MMKHLEAIIMNYVGSVVTYLHQRKLAVKFFTGKLLNSFFNIIGRFFEVLDIHLKNIILVDNLNI